MLNALKYTLYWRILIGFFHTKKLRILHTDTKHCSLGEKKAHAGNTCSSTKVSCRNEHLRFLKFYLPGVISKYCQNTQV